MNRGKSEFWVDDSAEGDVEEEDLLEEFAKAAERQAHEKEDCSDDEQKEEVDEDEQSSRSTKRSAEECHWELDDPLQKEGYAKFTPICINEIIMAVFAGEEFGDESTKKQSILDLPLEVEIDLDEDQSTCQRQSHHLAIAAQGSIRHQDEESKRKGAESKPILKQPGAGDTSVLRGAKPESSSRSIKFGKNQQRIIGKDGVVVDEPGEKSGPSNSTSNGCNSMLLGATRDYSALFSGAVSSGDWAQDFLCLCVNEAVLSQFYPGPESHPEAILTEAEKALVDDVCLSGFALTT